MADVPQPLIQPADTYAHVFVCCLYVSPASVTKQEVIDAVYQQTGRKVAESDLEVPEIKALGTFECSVKLVRMLLSAWLGSNSYAQLCLQLVQLSWIMRQPAWQPGWACPSEWTGCA